MDHPAGTFDRTTLKLTPDNPQWAAEVLADPKPKTAAAALHYAYDYGVGRFPKTYVSEDGRRISWRWCEYQIVPSQIYILI